jgi:predicted nuclease of predicted toxin-antitoxin system
MSLLFDQNISFRICKLIQNSFPNAKQVRELGLENYSDDQIWNFAKTNNYTIVTFDSDFFEISNLKGHPPKIIWLRTGNLTTENIRSILELKKDSILDFISNPIYNEISCLEIN